MSTTKGVVRGEAAAKMISRRSTLGRILQLNQNLYDPGYWGSVVPDLKAKLDGKFRKTCKSVETVSNLDFIVIVWSPGW